MLPKEYSGKSQKNSIFGDEDAMLNKDTVQPRGYHLATDAKLT
jgi:hypothetical protein